MNCLAATYLEEECDSFRYRYAVLCGGEAAKRALGTAELDPDELGRAGVASHRAGQLRRLRGFRRPSPRRTSQASPVNWKHASVKPRTRGRRRGRSDASWPHALAGVGRAATEPIGALLDAADLRLLGRILVR